MVSRSMWTSELGRVALGAVRASLSMLYDISSTSFDRECPVDIKCWRLDKLTIAVTLLPQQCSYSWCLCSRVLCKLIDAATASGDAVTANVFRSEIEVFRRVCIIHLITSYDCQRLTGRMAMRQYGERYPCGQRHLQMVDDLLVFAASTDAKSRSQLDSRSG